MQIYHSLTVDVAKRNQYKAVSAKQLDCNSRFLKIELQNNGSAFDIPNNVTVAMAVERNGETKAFNCKYEGDYIVAPLDTWILQESGYVDCEIILLDTETNSKLSSFLFSLEIEQNIYNDEDIKSDENYDLLLTLIGDVKSSQIVSITEKVEGLKHTYTVLFGNGESKEFVISDGAKGDPGTPGKDGAPGTTVYSELSDKPSINDVTLVGNKTLSELGINIPTKLTDLENDGTFIENNDYASYSHAGIVKLSVGGGITVDDEGVATVEFPLKEVTSKTDDIRVTHGSGIYTLEFNSGKYAKLQDIYAKQDKLTAGDNITIVNNTISASCVIKPLALSTNANAPTLLADIGAGAYITTNTGYVATSGGFKKVIGKGAELIIVLTKKDGVSQLCVTVQTGGSVLYFWDEMTASDTNEIFLSTLSVKKDLDDLTDRNVMSGLLSKTMLEERIKKSEIGDGLKFTNGKLSLDIPTATANTTYGGGA